MSRLSRQFTIRSVSAGTAAIGLYLSLARVYGFGRAIICLSTVALGLSSSLFFVASYYAATEEDQIRHSLASGLLGFMILVGATLIGLIVFQAPPQPVIEVQP